MRRIKNRMAKFQPFQLQARIHKILPVIHLFRVCGVAVTRNGHLPKVCFFTPSLVHSKISVTLKSLPVDFHRAISRGKARWGETRRDEARRSETSEIFDLNASSNMLRGTVRKTRINSVIRAGNPRAIVK